MTTKKRVALETHFCEYLNPKDFYGNFLNHLISHFFKGFEFLGCFENFDIPEF